MTTTITDELARYHLELSNLEHEIAEAAILCYESNGTVTETSPEALRLETAIEHLITFKEEREVPA